MDIPGCGLVKSKEKRGEAPSSVAGSPARRNPLQSKIITITSKDWGGEPQVKTTLFQGPKSILELIVQSVRTTASRCSAHKVSDT